MASWTAVVLTCQSKNGAQAFQKELECRQRKGYIDEETLILTVEDPKQQVGSGGATLNALLVAAEHLGARRRLPVISPEVFQDAKILIMHMGRNFPFDPCGRTFTTLPVVTSSDKHADLLVCNIDLLLHTLTHKIAVNSPPGVWVCSTDMFLRVTDVIDNSEFQGHAICAISVPASVEYACNHGVYTLNEKHEIQDIIYRGTESAIKSAACEDGTVALVSGVVYFGVAVTETLLSFHTQPPLDACTYMGLDSGASPIQLSLFFDFLLAVCGGLTQDMFVMGSGQTSVWQRQARTAIWKRLHQQYSPAKAILIKNGQHFYMENVAKIHQCYLLDIPITNNGCPWKPQNIAYSYIDKKSRENKSIVINSYIEGCVKVFDGSVISNCSLSGPLTIGENCIISGLISDDFQKTAACDIPANTVIQVFHISLPSFSDGKLSHRVMTVLGTNDLIMEPAESMAASFCNKPWSALFDTTGIKTEDLWPTDMANENMTLLNARLFPVAHATHKIGLVDLFWLYGNSNSSKMLSKWRSSWRLSLEDILSAVDLESEFVHRRELFYQVAEMRVRNTLLKQSAEGLTGLYWGASVDGYQLQMLTTLDNVAMECESAGIAARALASIADVLGSMAAGRGGMRSGPAANPRWAKAFQILESGDVRRGIVALAKEREGWLDRADLLVRAARHYEGAAQILIRHAVMTARQLIKTSPCEPTASGQWVVGQCAARADLSGGWSDTPPITYEHGGAVTNVALLIDGQRPIGAKARRLDRAELVLHLDDGLITVRQLSDMADHNQPHAPGALLKAAFICAEIIEYPSETSLEQQLTMQYGGGFELHTWSHLPHGSGMGTSSILAGVIMAVLWKSAGKSYTNKDLIHAVLHLEQMLTTGGGWQDQVGGLIGGLKVGHSPPSLPLTVEVKPLNVSQEIIEFLNSHLVLVYTGKTRLARNLLQTVVRNWYARDPQIVAVEDDLVATAWRCAQALEDGNMVRLGQCLDEYWREKKLMAPGCEPVVVTRMLEALQGHMYGACMAGAGGGGFIYLLMRDTPALDAVKRILATIPGAESATVHSATVDMEGLVIHMEDAA